ncbi:hydroxyphenylacetyl-CoA thioesterase PaaI [Nemorincola caseinilytica]|uniref:Hydroxyphenylacetyl-CoA thioesterase PaaI n=1 Tax=Nemorincola caseinilytica TaxID=2054315 RepID=A0ABP8NGQ1_9BACT
MDNTPQQVLNTMLDKDRFSEWLGIIVDEYKEGYCRLHFVIRQEMLNGFGIAHGGILFSAADSAFAFACNSHGRLSVALDVSISFVRTATADEVMTVEAREIHNGNRTGFYDITVVNERQEVVALFKGTAYRTGKMVCDDSPAT